METSRETFEGADSSTQNLILFDSIKSLDDKICKRHAQHDQKHDELDKHVVKSGRINRATSAGSGLVGGFLAVVMSKIFGIS